MKKILSLMASVVLMLTLVACGSPAAKDSGLEGKYTITAIEMDGSSLDYSMIKLSGQEDSMYFEFDNNTATLITIEGTFEDIKIDAEKMEMEMDGDVISYEEDGDNISLDLNGMGITFTKEDSETFKKLNEE